LPTVTRKGLSATAEKTWLQVYYIHGSVPCGKTINADFCRQNEKSLSFAGRSAFSEKKTVKITQNRQIPTFFVKMTASIPKIPEVNIKINACIE